MSPWSQALVAAMFKLRSSKKLNLSYAEIAKQVSKVGGGHPSKQAIATLHSSTKQDKHWYPGKEKPDAQKRGPKNKFSKAQKRIVANSAMALKRVGVEPTVANVMARCPRALTNPETGEAFTSPTITKVFKTMCYDVNPARTTGTHCPLPEDCFAQATR